MRRAFLALAVAAAAMLPPSLSLADEGAERIRAELVSLLGLEAGEGGSPLLSQGAVAVTPEAEGYGVVLSGLRLPAAGGSYEAVGDIAFRLRRQEGDYLFDRVSLPQGFAALIDARDLAESAQEIPPVELSMQWSTLALSGRWAAELKLLTDLDLAIDDLVVNLRLPETGETVEIAIEEVRETVVTDRTDPRAWSLSANMQVGRLRGRLPNLMQDPLTSPPKEVFEAMGFTGDMVARLAGESLQMDLEIVGFDPQAYGLFTEALVDYVEAAAAGEAALLQQKRQAILDLDRVIQGFDLSSLWRGGRYEEEWPGGLVYESPLQESRYTFEAPAGSKTVRLSFVGSGEASMTRREGLAELYALGQSGSGGSGGDQTGAAAQFEEMFAAVLPLTRLFELLIPTSSDVAFHVEKLPARESSDLLLQALAYVAAGAAEGELAEPVDLSVLAPFSYAGWLLAVQQAGTQILLERMEASGPLFWLAGRADLTVQADSRSGLVGAAELSLSDLDKAMKQARAQVEEELGLAAGAGAKGEIASAITLGLAFVKGLGELEVVDGEIVYRYLFELPAGAPATLNGRPLANLFGQ